MRARNDASLPQRTRDKCCRVSRTPVLQAGLNAPNRVEIRPRAATRIDQSVVETLMIPLGVGVQIRRARRQSDDLDTGIAQEISERRSELGIPIKDQKSLVCQKPIDRVGNVSANLHPPCFFGGGSDFGDLDLARRELDDEEDVEGHEAAAITSQWVLRNWLQVVRFPEDIGDSRAGNTVANIL